MSPIIIKKVYTKEGLELQKLLNAQKSNWKINAAAMQGQGMNALPVESYLEPYTRIYIPIKKAHSILGSS